MFRRAVGNNRNTKPIQMRQRIFDTESGGYSYVGSEKEDSVSKHFTIMTVIMIMIGVMELTVITMYAGCKQCLSLGTPSSITNRLAGTASDLQKATLRQRRTSLPVSPNAFAASRAAVSCSSQFEFYKLYRTVEDFASSNDDHDIMSLAFLV